MMCKTICLTSPDHWSLGSLMTCEKVDPGHDMPSNAVCQWVDNGLTYCLRKRSKPKIERNIEGDPKSVIVHNGLLSGVWTLSPNLFFKVM